MKRKIKDGYKPLNQFDGFGAFQFIGQTGYFAMETREFSNLSGTVKTELTGITDGLFEIDLKVGGKQVRYNYFLPEEFTDFSEI